MKDQKRRAAFARSNLDILPRNPSPPARLQRLKRRFFCGKASGIMLRGYRATTIAIGAFGRGENPFRKSRRAREHFANTLNFDNVYADGNDHGRN